MKYTVTVSNNFPIHILVALNYKEGNFYKLQPHYHNVVSNGKRSYLTNNDSLLC